MDKIDSNLKKKFSIAEKLFAESKYQAAINKYKEILIDYPMLASAINNIGLSYECLNKYDEAIKFYKHSSTIHPEEKIFINNISNIYFKIKDYNNTIKEIDKSLLIDNLQIKIIEIKASCLIKLHLTKEANKYLNKYLLLFLKSLFLNTLYGKNLINLNQHKLGLQYLKKGTGFIELNENKVNII